MSLAILTAPAEVSLVAAAPSPTAAHGRPAAPRPACGVLSLRIGAEAYGVELRHVREIRSYELPTRIAGARSDLLGVMDLRGTIVPVVDLRRRLGVEVPSFDDTTAVVVLQLHDRLVGAVVDAVSDVIDIAAGQWRDVPPMGHGSASALLAMAMVDGHMLQLLDIAAVVGDVRSAPRADAVH